MCDFDRHLARIASECSGSDVNAEKGAIFYNKDARAKAGVRRLLACLEGMENGAEMLASLAATMGDEQWGVLAKVLGRADWHEVEEFCAEFREKFDFAEVRTCIHTYVSFYE